MNNCGDDGHFEENKRDETGDDCDDATLVMMITVMMLLW